MSSLQTLLWIPRRRLEVVLLAVLVGSGCGGKKGDVFGTVTYQDKPLTIGTVTFLDASNQALGSSAIIDGKYAIGQVPVGRVKIIVTTPPSPRGNARFVYPRFKKTAPKDKDMTPSQEPRASRSVAPATLPAKFANPDESGLTYTVQPGKQEYPIDLK